MALVAAGVVVASGLLSAWTQTGGPSGLDTRYGALLGAKAVAVALVLVLGYVHRRRVRAGMQRVLALSSLSGEAALALVLVVGLTASLVGTIPGREAGATAPVALEAAPSSPFVTTVNDADGSLVATLQPLGGGRHRVELALFDPVGTPRPTDGATLAVAIGEIPPRAIPLLPDGVGAFRADDVSLPRPGRWLFTLTTITRGVTTARTFEVHVP